MFASIQPELLEHKGLLDTDVIHASGTRQFHNKQGNFLESANTLSRNELMKVGLWDRDLETFKKEQIYPLAAYTLAGLFLAFVFLYAGNLAFSFKWIRKR